MTTITAEILRNMTDDRLAETLADFTDLENFYPYGTTERYAAARVVSAVLTEMTGRAVANRIRAAIGM